MKLLLLKIIIYQISVLNNHIQSKIYKSQEIFFPTMTEQENTIGHRSKKYFIYMMIILALVQIMDAYSTSYTAAFPSSIQEEFLIIPFGFDKTFAQVVMQIVIAIATLGIYFVFFNQYLSDKFGRKKMLFITTLGMGLSALLLALSINIFLYTIFLFSTYLFFNSDMWLIYAGEEAPPEKKASYINILLACGILGPIMMPIFRNIFITETSPVWAWRGMTFLPIILGIPLSFVILFTIKETKIYEEGKITRQFEVSQILLKDNVKKLLQSDRKKEIWAILVIGFFTGLNFNFMQMAESFLDSDTILTADDAGLIIAIVALAVIIGYLSIGFLADRIGRIPLLYASSIILPIGTIFLYLGSVLTSGVFVICAIGISLGYVGYNGLLIVIRIIIQELVPTDKRGTGLGIRSLATSLGITSGFVLGSIFTLLISNLGISFIILSLPVLSHLYIIPKFIKETKGTDLSEVELKLKG